MLGVEKFTLLSGIVATATEIIGLLSLRDRRQIQDFETALLLKVPDEIVLMNALHDENDSRRLLVIRPGDQG